jgi:hypothetical protein
MNDAEITDRCIQSCWTCRHACREMAGTKESLHIPAGRETRPVA